MEVSIGTARLAEAMGALSLATGMATGQPLEHSLRRSLLAVWIAEELGLSSEQRNDVYYVALLGRVGCAIEGVVVSRYGEDDIALSAKVATVVAGRFLQMAAFGLTNFGVGESPLRRIGKVVPVARAGPAAFQAVCRDVAVRVGDMIDLGPAVRQALGQGHERWDGSGGPRGLDGEDIALAARIFHIAHDAEIFNRIGGIDGALAVTRDRAGRHHDPEIVARFRGIAEPLFRHVTGGTRIGVRPLTNANALFGAAVAWPSVPRRWRPASGYTRIHRRVPGLAGTRRQDRRP